MKSRPCGMSSHDKSDNLTDVPGNMKCTYLHVIGLDSGLNRPTEKIKTPISILRQTFNPYSKFVLTSN